MPNALPANVQNEIMAQVISKLLDSISNQANELVSLREENKELKIKLTFLYKTIILLKSSHSPIKINPFPSTQLTLRTNLSPFTSPQITKNKATLKKLHALTMNKAFILKGKISRNNDSNYSRKCNRKINVSINETPSNLITTHEKQNSSKFLSNTSSNGYITLSPKSIADYYQYQKGKKLSQSSIDGHSLTSKSKDKRAKIIRCYGEIQKINDKDKNVIKVSIIKRKK